MRSGRITEKWDEREVFIIVLSSLFYPRNSGTSWEILFVKNLSKILVFYRNNKSVRSPLPETEPIFAEHFICDGIHADPI